MGPLKVLDVGCHDGFIAHWLREQGIPLQVDGIELHPDAVAAARARGVNCVQGRAEQAPDLFEPGTYDAVVAQELIEHVPNVDQLLAALERMLNPTGRIYISTPDGVFGLGGNPHHLRALRSIDLADLLRRRGHLVDMNVGADGITNAAYRPGPRGREAAIYCGPSLQPWSPMDIYRTGLGGSETAAVRLAEALSERGWIVTVYGEIPEQCCYRDVIYRQHDVFDPLAPVDVLISSRLPEVFDRPTRARRRMLWLHDTDCGDRLTELRAEHVDDVLVLSGWHERHVLGLYPFLGEKVHRIRNGIDLDRFAGDAPERELAVAYTSSPDRGLDLLLEAWPEIRERCPGAVLRYAYSPVYWTWAERDPVVGAHAARIRQLSDQPGVEPQGALSQPDVGKLLRRSRVWCAPSWNTPSQQPFFETSCIGAMEAQAAGCIVVASRWGALPETVPGAWWLDGVDAVAGAAPGPRWRRSLVAQVSQALNGLTTEARWRDGGRRRAAELGWDGVAAMVEAIADRAPTAAGVG